MGPLIVARAYAKSLLTLSEQKKSLDIAEEFHGFMDLLHSSNEFECLLYFEIFTAEEKIEVIDKVFKKSKKFSEFFQNFLKFLILEKRIHLLGAIFQEVVYIDDRKKGFITGTIEGATDNISAADLKKLTNYVEKKLERIPKLTYKKSKKITAGYRLRVEDYQIDATIDHQLDLFKDSILGVH